MAFENDIFISYAHIDDQALIEGKKGWVSNLHRALEVRVAQLHGRSPRIWRDPKLKGNDVFGDELVQNLPKTAILLSILTPRYAQSDWCQRELAEFHRAAVAAGGVKVGNKTRIFKVVKTPVPLEQQPAGFEQVLGYEFFQTDPETGRVQELDQAFGDDAQRQYWSKLDDLAQDLVEMLSRLSGNGLGAEPAAGDDRKTVYVAPTGFDLDEARDEVVRDLTRRGHEVLPDRLLPLYAEGLAAYVEEALSRCDLSVHMIGQSYGLVPEGSTRSIVELQNALAAGRGKELPRLVWTPPDLEIEDPRQLAFVERLRTDAATHEGADLLEAPLETLKTAINDILSPPEKSGVKRTIFVARTGFDLREQHDALVSRLEADGHKVLPEGPLPLFEEGLTAAVRQALSRCDLSVHLIGERYGMVPEGSTRSVVELQHEIAAELCGSLRLAQMVWLPPDLSPEDERQRAVVERLLAEAPGHPRMELLRAPFEELETAVLEKLRPPPSAPEVEAAAESVAPHVYLICDQRDEEAAAALADYLFEQGLEVTLPVFEGDEGEIRQDHEENLRECDAAIVYYGAGNELWIRRQLRELIKSAGYGRSRPMTVRGVYVAPPVTPQKKRLRTREASVVEGSEPFDPSDLQPLLQPLGVQG